MLERHRLLSQLRHERALNALQERTPSQLPVEEENENEHTVWLEKKKKKKEENEHTVWLILQRGP
jgi:hypothetical protein